MPTSTESPTLAGPPGDCCVQGYKHEGTPVGRRETIAGIDTYVTDPPAGTQGPKKVLLYFSDIFGAFYINSQLLQDYFASQGFHVLGIDYLFGDYVQNHSEILATPDTDGPLPSEALFKWATMRLGVAQEATPKWIDAVRDLHGADALYFCVGYCFGGPFSMDLAATDKIAAAAFAHPSFLSEDRFKALKKPLLLSCAEIDPTFPTDARHKAEKVLADIKATYHIQVFSGVHHGFATRGDITQDNIRWAREQCAQSVVDWFKRFSVAKV